jgi:hypothetical protein
MPKYLVKTYKLDYDGKVIIDEYKVEDIREYFHIISLSKLIHNVYYIEGGPIIYTDTDSVSCKKDLVWVRKK